MENKVLTLKDAIKAIVDVFARFIEYDFDIECDYIKVTDNLYVTLSTEEDEDGGTYCTIAESGKDNATRIDWANFDNSVDKFIESINL